MDRLQVLALKKSVTVYEAAQLLAQGKGGVSEWEALIIESIELRELAANVRRWTITDYWNGDRDGGINQMETTMQRADLDPWIASKGLSIGLAMPAAMPTAAALPTPTPTPQAAPASETVAPAADRARSDAPGLSIYAIPGTVPGKGAGQVAIRIAWALECELEHRPAATQVMSRMRELANSGQEFTDVLRKTAATVQGVNWITKKGKDNNYSLEALEMALTRWWRSRQ